MNTGRPRVMHASGVLLGPHGVLITGPSGSGKSLLALDLLDQFALRGAPAFLVADDGVEVTAGADGLAMGAPEAIAGRIELRGRGIIAVPHVDRAPLHLVVELVDALVRMPEEEAFTTTLAGVRIARCPVPQRGAADPVHQRLLVLAALRTLD